MFKIVLFQPEIAGNVGNIIRSCVCFNCELHIIEPTGFPFDLNRIKKSALDYIHQIKIFRYPSFENFYENNFNDQHNNLTAGRLILATTKSQKNIFDFKFEKNDVILFGMESAGVPENIRLKSDYQITIAMKNDARSLNLAVSCGIFMAKASYDIGD
jgi:tRNA (cytidine/uridine-2'-O-)-methyltransferase